ncbi:uncharacterized protein LOC126668744 [Mercurialis annua]|uniref:uncharacterized protein LOC126668744 n=1 Tax=Mercurialis annua TaxID=3986 RepID=UPI0024AE33F1|nr:uncharacterized protein LOC126668744 [Mercurialis annua]
MSDGIPTIYRQPLLLIFWILYRRTGELIIAFICFPFFKDYRSSLLQIVYRHYHLRCCYFVTEKEGKTPTVPALFLYTHTINHDGITFVDNKAADTYARFKEILASRLAVDGSNPTDTEENQIWYELVEGEKKQRVYGVGSSAPSYYSDVARFPDQPTPSQANQDFDNLRRAHEKLQDQFRVLQYQFDVVVDHLRTDCPIPLVFSTPAASSPSRPSDDTVDTTDLDDEF